MHSTDGYTYEIANESSRLSKRTGAAIMPQSAAWDAVLYRLYVPVRKLILPLIRRNFVGLFMAPVREGDAGSSNGKNISATRGSNTARGMLLARAIYAGFGMGVDTLAARLLRSHAAHLGGHWRRVALLTQMMVVASFRLFRRDPVRDFVARSDGGALMCDSGTAAHFRTAWLDDVVDAFAARTPARAQLVVLGAGYDTRCYRMSALSSRFALFEVDAHATQAAKLQALREVAIDASRVVFAAADFTMPGDWQRALRRAGCDTSLPTCVLWEGVSMYLSRDAVVDTLRSVRNMFPTGSVVAFDYLATTYANDPREQQMMAAVGEPFCFAMSPPLEVGNVEAQRLMRDAGLILAEHVAVDGALQRYGIVRSDESILGVLRPRKYGGLIVGMVP